MHLYAISSDFIKELLIRPCSAQREMTVSHKMLDFVLKSSKLQTTQWTMFAV